MQHSLQLGAERFEAFGTSHLVVLVLFAIGAWGVVVIGRRHRDSEAAVRFSRMFAVAIPVFTIPLQVLQLLPGDWALRTSLPLHLCDLAWLAAVVALSTHRWWATALIYYWGLTLTTQAMLTPSLDQDWPEPRFLMFWGMHFLIVWAAIYLTWGLRLAPTWRGYRFTVACTFVWAASVFAFNTLADVNYGYLNEKPATASILDFLGPWPLYVVLEIAIILSVWALMTVPWTRAGRRRAGEPHHASV